MPEELLIGEDVMPVLEPIMATAYLPGPRVRKPPEFRKSPF